MLEQTGRLEPQTQSVMSLSTLDGSVRGEQMSDRSAWAYEIIKLFQIVLMFGNPGVR